MHPKLKPMLILWVALSTPMSGCDDRAIQIAREAADRQAQQNTAMAQLNEHVADGTRRLVDNDAMARKEIVIVHRQLQSERSRLDSNWSNLEQERRRIATQRRTESMLVALTKITGVLAVGVALLGFCWYALVVAHRGDATDAQTNELLVLEILAGEPLSPQVRSNCSQSLLGQSPVKDESIE